MEKFESLKDHEKRVVTEFRELEDRIKKLGEFRLTPVYFKLPQIEQELLCNQHFVMITYRSILSARVARF